MNLTKTSAELKSSAKAQLLGNYGKMISAFLMMDFGCANFQKLVKGATLSFK